MTDPLRSDPAVRILRLSLAGFGIYEKPSRFAFPPGACVMEGPNEAGKSTLLNGLAAVWFGLPADAAPSRFGSGRFRSFSRPREFWGELEWERAGRRFRLHRSFETHRVRLTEVTSSGSEVLFEGEHNPRATSSAGSAFRSLLSQHLGISELDLFLQTFCMSQPLPDEAAIGAELQHLLSGSRAGRVDDVLQQLFLQIRDLTKGTGDLGLIRPGATRPQNQKEPGRIERLETELTEAAGELGKGRDILERLNAQNEKLEETQQEIRKAAESLELAERREEVLRRWLDLSEERRSRQASLQQAQKGLDELSSVEREKAPLEPELHGRFAPFANAGPGLERALEALQKSEAERRRRGQSLDETAAEAIRLEEEADALEKRLAGEFASVRGRPGLLSLRRQAAEAGRRRQERTAVISTTERELEEAGRRLESLSSWQGVRPDLLRPEAEAILNDVKSLESIRDRMAEIGSQSEERHFLTPGRLESLRAKIELEERRKLLASRLRDIEKEHDFEASLLASHEEERRAKENEVRLLEEQIEREFPGVAGRSDLLSVADRIFRAGKLREDRRRKILTLYEEKKALEDAAGAAGDSAGFDPPTLRRRAEEFARDVALAGEIDRRLTGITEQTSGREFLSDGKLDQLREAISRKERLRELSLRIRELELDDIRRRHEEAGRTGEAAAQKQGPVSIWLSLLAGAALGAGLYFGLDMALPVSAGIGAGIALVLRILNAVLLRRKTGRARPLREPDAADAGDSAAALAALRDEQADLENREAAASEELGPYAGTTGPELARLEERWALLDAEAERLRRDRAGLHTRLTGTEDCARLDAMPASGLQHDAASLLNLPGAPAEGSVGELSEWLAGLDPQYWSRLEDEAGGREETRRRAAEVARDLQRLQSEDEADTEVEELARRLHPLSSDLGMEEIQRQVEECAALEKRIAALRSRLDEIPGADELRARREAADRQLAGLWDGVREVWPEAPGIPALDPLEKELERLESAAYEQARDLGPYAQTTRSELDRLRDRWRLHDEETGRLNEREREILVRRFGLAESGVRWESVPAAELPPPFDEVLRLPGAPAGAAAGEVVAWLRSLDPDRWEEFRRASSRRREGELELDRIRRDLERLRREHEEDRELERLTAELGPFTPETPEETITALLEGCSECEKSLHSVKEQIRALPPPEAREEMLAEAGRRLEQAWEEVESVWPGARERASGEDLPGWLARTREEERAFRECRRKAEALDDRVQTILRTAGIPSRAILESQRDEANAVLGQVVLRIQEVEREDPFLAASKDQADPIERARSLQAEAERLGEESAHYRKALRAAEERERHLIRNLAGLEGAVPPNVARMEVQIRQVEEDLVRLRRERDALALAYRWVREAADNFQAAYREDLEARVTGHFQAITGSPGRRVSLDEEFACRVIDSEGVAIAPEQLSQGARDQLDLSIRLAVADLLTQAVPLPLFFDDPFVHYDAGRLRNLRETLKAVAAERQWLLLTHRSDLAEWADPVVVEAG